MIATQTKTRGRSNPRTNPPTCSTASLRSTRRAANPAPNTSTRTLPTQKQTREPAITAKKPTHAPPAAENHLDAERTKDGTKPNRDPAAGVETPNKRGRAQALKKPTLAPPAAPENGDQGEPARTGTKPTKHATASPVTSSKKNQRARAQPRQNPPRTAPGRAETTRGGASHATKPRKAPPPSLRTKGGSAVTLTKPHYVLRPAPESTAGLARGKPKPEQGAPAGSELQTDQGGQTSPGPQPTSAALIGSIRLYSQQRRTLLEMRTKITNAAGAYLRLMLGWKLTAPAPLRAAIEYRVQKMLGNRPKPVKPAKWTREEKAAVAAMEATPVPGHAVTVLTATLEALTPIDRQIRDADKALAKLTAELPTFPWLRAVGGIAPANIGSMIAILGDPGQYRSPAGIWKRMGLAPPEWTTTADGKRKAANAQSWRRPLARSVMWVVGVCMIRALLGTKKGGKKQTRCRYVDEVFTPRRAATKARGKDWPPGRCLKDANRVMVKAFLRDWWIECRKAAGTYQPQAVHASQTPRSAEA